MKQYLYRLRIALAILNPFRPQPAIIAGFKLEPEVTIRLEQWKEGRIFIHNNHIDGGNMLFPFLQKPCIEIIGYEPQT